MRSTNSDRQRLRRRDDISARPVGSDRCWHLRVRRTWQAREKPKAYTRPAVSDEGSEQTAVRTFLIADIRGYTTFTQAEGDEAAGRLASRFAQVVREDIEAHGGSVLELRGDEAMCTFGSPRGPSVPPSRCSSAVRTRSVPNRRCHCASASASTQGRPSPSKAGIAVVRSTLPPVSARSRRRRGTGQRGRRSPARRVDELVYARPRANRTQGHGRAGACDAGRLRARPAARNCAVVAPPPDSRRHRRDRGGCRRRR